MKKKVFFLGVLLIFSAFMVLNAQKIYAQSMQSTLPKASQTNTQNNETASIGFSTSNPFVYKDEHYNLEPNGSQVLNQTVWSKIVVEKTSQSSDKKILNVTWSLYEAKNVQYADLVSRPGLWKITSLANYTSELNMSDPYSLYGVLFNEQNASMRSCPSKILLDTSKFYLFYVNELGNFNNTSTKWMDAANGTNQIVNYSLTPSIGYVSSRVLTAHLSGNTAVRLNGSYPSAVNPWLNMTFRLKLYLVYGQASNLLLSYNINYTTTESIWNNATQRQDNSTISQIIFWNIRQPENFTLDYPVLEIFELNIPNIPNFQDYLVGVILIIIVYGIISRAVSSRKLKKILKKEDALKTTKQENNPKHNLKSANETNNMQKGGTD